MRREESDSKKTTSGAEGSSAPQANGKPAGRRLTPAQIDDIRHQPPLIMSAAEAAVYTDTSERNFRELADKGVFPSIRVGRRVLFRRDAIDEALARLESKHANEAGGGTKDP